MMSPNISIIVPVFNEADSLAELYEEIRAAVPADVRWELIFVDDGSTDDTARIARTIAAGDDRVSLVSFYKNFGKADALDEGFKRARFEIIITMDGDLQDDPGEIPNLLAKLDEGWDMVSGWKKKRHDPLSKRLPSKVWNAMTQLLTGLKLHDFNCGLKAYRAKVVKTIELYGGLHRYIPALAKQKGFTVTEIPVNHRARRHGQTKYHTARFFHGFFDLLTITFLGKYLSRPLHFFGLIGLVLTGLGFGICTWLTIGWFAGHWIGDRPVFFLGILLLIVGVQFFSLGLLGEMVVKTNRRSEQRVRKIQPDQ
ncbi:MAG: glycosyltransferase family 2 protein [FCB group bacterium]|nr:glycosyltransferase family 2 protein [FCB group bacterium]